VQWDLPRGRDQRKVVFELGSVILATHDLIFHFLVQKPMTTLYRRTWGLKHIFLTHIHNTTIAMDTGHGTANVDALPIRQPLSPEEGFNVDPALLATWRLAGKDTEQGMEVQI